MHCVQAAATPITIAVCGPNRMSAISSAACETERVDSFLAERTSFTFQIEVRQTTTSNTANAIGRG